MLAHKVEQKLLEKLSALAVYSDIPTEEWDSLITSTEEAMFALTLDALDTNNLNCLTYQAELISYHRQLNFIRQFRVALSAVSDFS